jgi:hypothetical protein
LPAAVVDDAKPLTGGGDDGFRLETHDDLLVGCWITGPKRPRGTHWNWRERRSSGAHC